MLAHRLNSITRTPRGRDRRRRGRSTAAASIIAALAPAIWIAWLGERMAPQIFSVRGLG
jgi:hypothetical protein